MRDDGGTVGHARFASDRIAILLAVGFGILLALLLWSAGTLLIYLKTVLFFPFSLDYGEGIVWQQMRDMLRGTAYAPLQVYPAIVYHYPPVYHMASAALAALTGLDQLVAGRLVSILSSFATAAMVGLLTARALPMGVDGPMGVNGRIRFLCSAIAGLLFLACYPVMIWTPLMRVDMVSGALGLAGILLALRALDRPAWIYGAATMFLLSVYAKQISVAAPMAAFCVLLLVRPGLAVRGIAFSTVVGLLILAGLSWATDGGFLNHILFYNINRLLLSSFDDILLPQLVVHMMLILLSILGAATSWRGIRQSLPARLSLVSIRETLAQNHAAVAALMLLIFLGLKTIMLLGILKSGASINYMIEWFSAVAIFAGIALVPMAARAMGGPASGLAKLSPVAVGLALVALPLQLALLPVDFPAEQAIARIGQNRAQILARIASSTRPVIADEMALLIRAGRDVRWESAITAELAASGKYDQIAFARLVRAHCFGLFVIDGRTDRLPFFARYNPPVAAAILSAYPREEKIGEFTLRWPSATPAPDAHCPVRRMGIERPT